MIKIDIALPIGYTASDIKGAIASALPVDESEIRDAHLVRRTLDLSDTRAPRYKCTVAFAASDEREAGLLKIRNRVRPHDERVYTPEVRVWNFRPVVVGAGPAGLFAALTLAESGARPIVLERGLPVAERRQKVELYNRLGVLDPECNIQFGEGGAGTFSDGKLKVGSKDEYKNKIISELIATGATEDIAFSATAHLGTDKLELIVAKVRERIISLGGEFIFGARMSALNVKNSALYAVEYIKDGVKESISTSAAVIAIGHSARDSVKALYLQGIKMESRPFGVGMRLEHKREYINKIVYRDAADMIEESASYHLVTHLPGGRSVYSFCMCPGGSVVAASSDPSGIVTNGMSEYSRMAENSNAAILVSVTPDDFGSEHPLAGFEYQKRIEHLAYARSDSPSAPVIRLSDLMEGSAPASLGEVSPSYPCGTHLDSPENYLPPYIPESIRAAIPDFDAWLPGYAYEDAVFTGPETRTTSPIRMLRDESGVAVGHCGIYPAGEGAGYAGGIISSAYDGIREADKLIKCYGK